MPKYNLSVQPVKYRPTASNPQIEDAFMSQEFEVTRELFGPNPGKLTTAKHIFTRLEDGSFMEEALRTTENLLVSIHSNALFVTDRNGCLRQIGLENNNGEINITVSVPVEELALPPRPTWWTHVKSFFGNKAAREQVKAYNDTKEFNDQFEALVNNEKYGIKRNPNAAPTQASQAEEVEKQQPEVKGPEVKAEPLKPSKMNPEQFYNHLEAMKKQGEEIDIFNVSRSASVEEFYKSLAQIMEGQIARNMKAEADKFTDPAEKNAFLDGRKHLYTSLVAGLGNFIANEIDEDVIRERIANKETSLLMVTVMGIKKNGVEGYMKSIQAQNEVNKQEMEQSQPSAQVQAQAQTQVEQGAAQIQQQQPEPKPAQQGMGGPSLS